MFAFTPWALPLTRPIFHFEYLKQTHPKARHLHHEVIGEAGIGGAHLRE